MEFTPAELLLDVTNPRFEPTANQRDAINGLLADRDKMLALAGDIVEKNMLNPAESPIVVEENGSKVVVEGNRRLACLKVLMNPDLADDARTRSAFEKLAVKGTGPDRIEVWLAPSREAARPWIELRHTGQNGGVGVNPWTTEQQHRFDRRRGTQADRALTFTDGVASAFTGDKEVLDALQAAKSRAVTTVGRVVADPDLRGAFGFDLVGGELLFLHDRAAMRQALLRLLRDLANNPVGTFMGKGDRRDYYQKIASADLPDKDSRLPQAMPAAELPTDPTELDGHEAQAVNIDDAPHVSAVMLRVILELVLTEAGGRYGWHLESDKLHQKVTKTIKELDPDCDSSSKCNKKLQPAYVAGNVGRGGVAIVDLNQAVHNFDKIASPADVRARSADFGPLLVAVDQYFGQNP